MKISQGEPFAYDVTVTGQDWTGYTGTVTFKTHPKANWRRATEWPFSETQEPFLTVTATGNAAGLVQFGLTAAQTDLFPALPRVGFFRQAVCQIEMTNASTGDVQIFQATVSVAARI
jgi:hypothetical protein